MFPEDRLQRVFAQARWWGTVALLFVTLALAALLAAKLAVLTATGYWFLLPFVLQSWRTVLLLALLVLLLGLWGRVPDGPSLAPRRLYADRRRWGLALLLGAALPAAVLGERARNEPAPNALGLRASVPDGEFWIDDEHPHRPRALVTTNALGFRDEAWSAAPRPGSVRLAVIGDSYVFGAGVPRAEGLLDRQVEAALRGRHPEQDFEVLNVAYPGWGFVSYFQAARRLLDHARPQAIVIGSLGVSDWHLLEHNQVLQFAGPAAYRLLRALGTVDELHEASVLHAAAVSRDPQRTLSGEEHVERALRELLEAADAAGTEVVVWEYYEPFRFFDRFQAHRRFHRAGWPPGFDRRWDGWGNDPHLAIPIDRHPTGEANRLIAEHLAPLLARLAVRGGSGKLEASEPEAPAPGASERGAADSAGARP